MHSARGRRVHCLAALASFQSRVRQGQPALLAGKPVGRAGLNGGKAGACGRLWARLGRAFGFGRLECLICRWGGAHGLMGWGAVATAWYCGSTAPKHSVLSGCSLLQHQACAACSSPVAGSPFQQTLPELVLLQRSLWPQQGAPCRRRQGPGGEGGRAGCFLGCVHDAPGLPSWRLFAGGISPCACGMGCCCRCCRGSGPVACSASVLQHLFLPCRKAEAGGPAAAAAAFGGGRVVCAHSA